MRSTLKACDFSCALSYWKIYTYASGVLEIVVKRLIVLEMRACKKAQEFWSLAASRKSYKKTEFLIEIPRIRGGHFALKFQGAMVNHIRENSRPKCHILFTENRQLKRRFYLLTKYSLLNKIKTNKLRFLWVVKLRNSLPIDSRRINAVWKCRRALNFIFLRRASLRKIGVI